MKHKHLFMIASRPSAAPIIFRSKNVCQMESVTRLGDLLYFGQLFNFPNSQANFVKVLKSILFLVKSFLDNFYRHLAIFSGYIANGACSRVFIVDPIIL